MGYGNALGNRPPLCGAITGIGGLPLIDPVAAIDCIAEYCPEIPFWPQLPRRSETEEIIGQAMGALADLIERRPNGFGYQVRSGLLDAAVERLHSFSGRIDAARAAGIETFDSALGAGRFQQSEAIKGQIEGPISVACYLYSGDRPFVADPAPFAAICALVTRIMQWQVERLGRLGHPVVFFIDEPALCLHPSEGRLDLIGGLRRLIYDIRSAGAMAGLHCCAELPFDLMCQADPDILSFDAHRGLETFFANPNARAFVAKGGHVAYGMIPAVPVPEQPQAGALFALWLLCVSEFGDIRQAARQALITSTCGLGLLDESAVAPSFRLARQLGALIERLALDRDRA